MDIIKVIRWLLEGRLKWDDNPLFHVFCVSEKFWEGRLTTSGKKFLKASDYQINQCFFGWLFHSCQAIHGGEPAEDICTRYTQRFVTTSGKAIHSVHDYVDLHNRLHTDAQKPFALSTQLLYYFCVGNYVITYDGDDCTTLFSRDVLNGRFLQWFDIVVHPVLWQNLLATHLDNVSQLGG